MAYYIGVRLKYHQQRNGSWVAMCSEFPVCVTAPTRSEARRRAFQAFDVLTEQLDTMSEDEALGYLKERGLRIEQTADGDEENLRVPVLV